MNPVQIVEAARPEVGPMPAVDRRHLRERLFDVAMRSQTDHGPMEVISPNTRGANALRLGALALLGVTAVGGLIFSASREMPGSPPAAIDADGSVLRAPASVPVTIAQAPRPTIAPTTTAPPVAGSAETPLLLPPERNRLDELTVVRHQLGGSALLLRAPDSSTISVREVDGIAPEPPGPPATDDDGIPLPTVPPRSFASITVTPTEPEATNEYDIAVPCGSVTVLDSGLRAPFRPEITQLFDAMRPESGTITIALPDGWSLISSGPSTDEFTFGLPVEVGGREVTVTLAQFPGGSLAAAGYGDRQYGPATFLGQPAWIHRDVEDPARYDIISVLGTTAFRIGTRDIALSELEGVMTQLTPGNVDEWVKRFGALPVNPDPDIRTCSDQPEFVVS